jgi:hypothetical protein
MALKFEYDKEKRTATVCGVEDKSCEQIVIPSTVEYYRKKYDVVAIKYEAFRVCIKLKSVTIPGSITSIGYAAFMGCSALKNVTFTGTVEQFNAIEIGGGGFSDVPAQYAQCSDGQVSLR